MGFVSEVTILEKKSKKLGRAKLDEHVGGIEGLQRWMIAGNGGYGPGIGIGKSGGNQGVKTSGK